MKLNLFSWLFTYFNYFTLYEGDPGGGGTGDPSGGGTGDPAAASADWFGTSDDDGKAYIAAKGWTDPAGVIKSYRDLETFKGYSEDQVVRIPDLESASSEDMNKIFNKFGRPENADGYDLPAAEGEVEKEFRDWLQTTLHDIGATKVMGQKLVERLSERRDFFDKGAEEQSAINLANDKVDLQKEWGVAHDVQLRAAQNAAATFGVTSEVIDKLSESMGFMGTMKFFSSIAEGLGEDKFIGGGQHTNFGGAMTPAQAKEKIAQLDADPNWVKRYNNGDTLAMSEMSNLHKMAAGGV